MQSVGVCYCNLGFNELGFHRTVGSLKIILGAINLSLLICNFNWYYQQTILNKCNTQISLSTAQNLSKITFLKQRPLPAWFHEVVFAKLMSQASFDLQLIDARNVCSFGFIKKLRLASTKFLYKLKRGNWPSNRTCRTCYLYTSNW